MGEWVVGAVWLLLHSACVLLPSPIYVPGSARWCCLGPPGDSAHLFIPPWRHQIRDLLLHGEAPAKGYHLQRDEHGNYVASGLHLVPVGSLEDVAECLAYGSKIRSTASTNMNAHSSRSHAVFTIHLDQEPVAGVATAGGCSLPAPLWPVVGVGGMRYPPPGGARCHQHGRE